MVKHTININVRLDWHGPNAKATRDELKRRNAEYRKQQPKDK